MSLMTQVFDSSVGLATVGLLSPPFADVKLLENHDIRRTIRTFICVSLSHLV